MAGTKRPVGLATDWAWSGMETKSVIIKVVGDATAFPSVADGVIRFTVPAELNGMNLISIGAHVYTASDGGTAINVSLYNQTDSCDMLSVQLTIDNSEVDSATAATAATIDVTHDDVATADVLRVDVNQCGANAKGFELRMGFQLPTA